MSFTEARDRPQYDTPFFVIRNDSDIDQLKDFLATAVYDVADWGQDKKENPLCRLGNKRDGLKYPDRVATICIKRFNLLELTKMTVEDRKKK